MKNLTAASSVSGTWRLALLVFAGLLGSGYPVDTRAQTSYDGHVESVIDGDTIEVLVDSGRDGVEREVLRIRLAGIDTPEYDQPWGQRAKEALVARVADEAVRVNAVATDRYGRIVGEVYASDVCVSCELVREGHAWVYRRYTDDSVLIGLEEDARAHQRGLWSLPPADRIPPWEWRRGRRTTAAPASSSATADTPPECDTKKSCAEMKTCAEARFHLEQCHRTRLDGDQDGTPCESLCNYELSPRRSLGETSDDAKVEDRS